MKGLLTFLLCFNLTTAVLAQQTHAPQTPHPATSDVRPALTGGQQVSGANKVEPQRRRFHQLQVNLNFTNHRSLDKLASPLIYRGNLGGLELSYCYAGQRHHHALVVGLAGGDLNTSVSHFKGAGSTLWFGYAYTHRVASRLEDRLQAFLGAALHASGNVLETNEVIKENVSWMAVYSLAFTAETAYQIGRGSLYLQTRLPLIALVSRPPYGTYNDALLDILEEPLQVLTSGGGVHTLGQFLALEQDVRYTYDLTSHFGLVIGYRFGLYRYDEPRPIRQLTNSMHVGIRYGI